MKRSNAGMGTPAGNCWAAPYLISGSGTIRANACACCRRFANGVVGGTESLSFGKAQARLSIHSIQPISSNSTVGNAFWRFLKTCLRPRNCGCPCARANYNVKQPPHGDSSEAGGLAQYAQSKACILDWGFKNSHGTLRGILGKPPHLSTLCNI